MFSQVKHQFNVSSIFLANFLYLIPQAVNAYALEDLHSVVDSSLDQSFRVRENTKMTLDGSETASSIQRTSHIANEFVFAGEKGWRVKRQLPISEVAREYRKTISGTDEHLQVMTPSNRAVEPREPITDSVWMQVLASPLQLAQQWSLAPSGIKLSRWLDDLRGLKGPLKNPEGDEITVEVSDDKSVKINFKGSILQDGKTRIGIESTWTMMDIGKITESDLNASLMRSS